MTVKEKLEDLSGDRILLKKYSIRTVKLMIVTGFGNFPAKECKNCIFAQTFCKNTIFALRIMTAESQSENLYFGRILFYGFRNAEQYMEEQNHEEKTEDWLAGQDIQDALSKAAGSVMMDAASKKLSPGFLHQGVFSQDVSEDIRSELILFLLENKLKLQSILSSGNGHRYLRKAFVNYWIAKTRVPMKDPVRYLYKHASDVLRTSENFYTVAGTRGGLAFGLSAACVRIPGLSEEDIEMIALPDTFGKPLTCRSVNKKKTLLSLAAYFRDQVSEMWGNRPVLVDLRDFVRWLCRYVPMTLSVFPETIFGQNISETTADERSLTDRIYFDSESVKKWAGEFADSLNEKEKTVFALRHGENFSLKKIAEKTGHSGSSGPKYLLKQAEYKLCAFLRHLPWLSPDDLNIEAFALFRETLLLLLRERKTPHVQP